MQENGPCKVPVIGWAKPKLFAFKWHFSKQTLRIMKLTAVLLLAACLQVSAKGFSQEKITISVNNAPLEQVLNSIKKQSGYRFIYRHEHISNIKVSIHVANATLSEALDRCLKSQKLTYNIVGKSIVISPAEDQKITIQSIRENEEFPFIDVKGRVVNENGDPVSDVTVTVKGTRKSTITNSNGVFLLATVDQDAILVFTHVSMESFELKVSGKTELAIRLRTKISALGDVTITVNTGYQQIPKERATGSFTQINNQTINLQPGFNIISRLNGVSNGVLFQDKPDGPGFMIRGLSTINGPKTPLIVIDNFPYEGDINNINPNDIESVTLLKDAAAASIWGTKAGNGVIVLTTKKGKFKKPLSVEFNSNFTIIDKPDLFYLPAISSSDYIDLEQLLFQKGFYNNQLTNSLKPALTPAVEIFIKSKNGQISSNDSSVQINALKQNDVRNDYNNYFYRKAFNQQYSLNFNGGTENIAYLFSFGFDKNMDQLYNRQKRLTFHFENSYRPFKNLLLNIGATYTNNDLNSGRPSYNSIKINSRVVPYLNFSDGEGIATDYRASYLDTAGGGKLLDWKYYPLEDYKHNTTKTSRGDLLANVSIGYQFFKNLSADIKYQYEKQLVTTKNLIDLESYAARDIINRFTNLNSTNTFLRNPVPIGSILNRSNSELHSNSARGQINYSQGWLKHNVSAIAGAEIRENHLTGNTSTIYGYNDNILAYSNVDFVNQYPTYVNGATQSIPSGQSFNDQTNRFVSYYGNAAYTYAKKYTVSVSGRRDASNLFGLNTNDKWNPFWSVGGAWDMSKESFYKLSFLPDLKVRATYGLSGNVDPSKTAVTVLSMNSGITYTNFNYAYIYQFANPELAWERVSMLNIGVDFSSKGDRISGSFEFYHKKGTRLFGPSLIDYTAGLRTTSIIKNVADIKGNGIDFSLNSKNLNGIFKWNTSLIFNYNNITVTNFYRASDRASTYIKGGEISAIEGRPIYSIVSYKWGGLDPTTGNPRGYLDGNLTTNYSAIINSTSRDTNLVYSGPSLPPYFGSLINYFTFNGFTATINITYKFGYYFRKPTINYTNLFNSGMGNKDYEKRWQKPGDEENTNVPSLVYPLVSGRDEFYANSEITVAKADNIRIQFVNLSYEFRKSQRNYLPFSNLTMYANVSNLGIIWRANKDNLDPDYPSNFPPQRGYTFGLKANF